MYDCHIHSCFSGDSEVPVNEACEAAIKLGLEGITFTDHLDYDYPGYEDDFCLIDFLKYSEQMDAARAKYSPDLTVFKGIEIGIQPHVIEQTIKIVRSYDFDYVLASIHILDGLDPYKESFYEGRTKQDAYERYLKEVLFMVRNITDYDCIGHPEYILRYAPYPDRAMRYADHADVFDEVFRQIISSGKGMEVNTGSFKDFPNRVTPAYDINVLKRYRELGGEIVTLASDAHFTRFIGYRFEEFRSLLMQAGFQYAAYFEKRKPVFYRL